MLNMLRVFHNIELLSDATISFSNCIYHTFLIPRVTYDYFTPLCFSLWMTHRKISHDGIEIPAAATLHYRVRLILG